MKKFINAFIVIVSLILLLQSLFSFYHVGVTFTPDFSIFYNSARHILEGKSVYHDLSLYTLFNYPITTAFLYIPLLVLPYSVAQFIFVAINMTSAIFCVFLSVKILRWKIPVTITLFITSLFLFSFPTKFTIGMGQSNLIGYCLILGSFFAYQKKYTKTSLTLFVIGILFKPVLGFLTLFYFLKKDWKYAFSALILAIFFFFVAPFLALRGSDVIIYIKDIVPHLLTMVGREVYYNQGISGFVARLTPNLFMRSIASDIFTILVLFTLWVQRKSSSVTLFALCLTVMVMIDSLSWQHHFVFVLLPMLLFTQTILKRKNIWEYILLLCVYFLIAGNIRNPFMFQRFPLLFILSHVFIGTLVLFIYVAKDKTLVQTKGKKPSLEVR